MMSFRFGTPIDCTLEMSKARPLNAPDRAKRTWLYDFLRVTCVYDIMKASNSARAGAFQSLAKMSAGLIFAMAQSSDHFKRSVF